MSRGRYGFGPATPDDGPRLVKLSSDTPPPARSILHTIKLGIAAVVIAQAVAAAIVSTSSGHAALAPIGQALRVLLVGPAEVEQSTAVVELDERPADGGEPDPAPGRIPGLAAVALPAPGPVPASGRMSARQIAAHARAAGFEGQQLVTAVAVALAESGGKVAARCHNTGSGCTSRRTPTTKSTDRGLWQINDHAWPDVTDQCADTPACAARQAWRISRHGRSWRPWTTYKRLTFARHLDVALAGILGRRPTAEELVAASKAAGADYRRTIGPLPRPVPVLPGGDA